MMYDELLAELRMHHCDAKEDDTQEVCEECAYDVIIADKSVPSGIASVCVCGLMHRAADAIEELSKRVPPVPHGRLIDADALIRQMKQKVQETSNLRYGWVDEVDLALAPVIIPAEEGER